MSYKLKPNKGVAKRFKKTSTGKMKHRHEKNSHLRSNRSGKLKRHLGRSSVLAEGHAKRMRYLLKDIGTRPNQIVHERAIAAAEKKSGADEKPSKK